MTDKISSEDPWEAYAAVYDALLHLRPYQDMLEATLVALDISGGQTILDAGCGTGNLLDLVTRRHGAVSCVGIDNQPAMLQQATKKTRGVSYLKADIDQALPFGEHSFDRIACTNVLYTTSDPKRLVAELHRILAPGGKLVLVNPVAQFSDGWVLQKHCESEKPRSYWEAIDQSPEMAEQLIREAIEDETIIAQMIEIRRITRRLGGNPNAHFFNQSELLTLMGSYGFNVLQCTETYADISTLITATKETS